MVVGDDVGGFTFCFDFLHACGPRFEFFFGVEIVVALVGGNCGIFGEPGVIAAAMKADVADRRGDESGWFERAADDGLIDVAETDAALGEKVVEGFIVPGGVTDFNDERIVLELREQFAETGEVFLVVVKGKRELEEDSAEFLLLAEDVEAGADGFFVGKVGTDFMGEALPEFCGKEKARIGGDLFDPETAMIGIQRVVEGGVDFNGVEKFSDVAGLGEAARFALGIENTFPVGVGPAGGAEAERGSWRSGHAESIAMRGDAFAGIKEKVN